VRLLVIAPCPGSRIKSIMAVTKIKLENLVEEVTLFMGLSLKQGFHSSKH
jgi:hypothetical protein